MFVGCAHNVPNRYDTYCAFVVGDDFEHMVERQRARHLFGVLVIGVTRKGGRDTGRIILSPRYARRTVRALVAIGVRLGPH